ncbi:MAG: GAF domain-containing protein [Fimbriimonas sp.]
MVQATTATELIEKLRASAMRGASLRRQAMELVSDLSGYNWSGIYRLEGETLVLDEYVGAATDHTRIQVGVGVCGTAVAQNQNQVVEDVRELTNYLACSLETRSEIVVLIRSAEGEILGQIDIDGHTVGNFDESDEALLAQIGVILAERWSE